MRNHLVIALFLALDNIPYTRFARGSQGRLDGMYRVTRVITAQSAR